MIVVKKRRNGPHFTKDFGNGTTSDRIILPGKDNCRVKMTMFRPTAGFVAEDIVYKCDETVHVIEGKLTLTLPDGSKEDLNTGDSYYVPAGTSYGVYVPADSEVLCVFSASADGTLPDDE